MSIFVSPAEGQSYEVFHHVKDYDLNLDADEEEGDEVFETGYYWWPCFPGCHPDLTELNPCGPFETEEAAIKDITEGMEDY